LPSAPAEVVNRPWGEPLCGLKIVGTGIPGFAAFGTRRFRVGKDFAAVLARHPVLRADLDDSSPGDHCERR
jgi:hypothetical protein